MLYIVSRSSDHGCGYTGDKQPIDGSKIIGYLVDNSGIYEDKPLWGIDCNSFEDVLALTENDCIVISKIGADCKMSHEPFCELYDSKIVYNDDITSPPLYGIEIYDDYRE